METLDPGRKGDKKKESSLLELGKQVYFERLEAPLLPESRFAARAKELEEIPRQAEERKERGERDVQAKVQEKEERNSQEHEDR